MGASNRRIPTEAFSVVVIIVVVAAMMFGAPCNAKPSIIPHNVALFVFGDSIYDVRNLAYTDADAGSNFLPYGETYFKKPALRFCDGRVIPDFIAQYAGLPFIPPYLQPNLTAADYTKGVSFAYAGAPVLVEDDTSATMVDLTKQVAYFLDVVEKLQEYIGVSETRLLLGRAVYLFSIGGIDYEDLVSDYNYTSLSASIISDFTTMVIDNITSHIQTIYNVGGRKFAFQNVGPIGCVPSQRLLYAEAGTKTEGCVPQMQYLAIEHNIRFSYAAINLTTKLPEFKYSIFDFFTQATNRVIYDNIFGFKETKKACCGSNLYNGEFSCGHSSEEFSVCSNPNEYLWFDPAHPTEKANSQYSRMFWSGSPNVVGPFTLKDLFSMPPSASFSSPSFDQMSSS